ncbi:uncharacterized protein A4U43_C05F8620 [Asparagus officinalis]|uniref:Uncharacterized protein n=1 Tax=Asparagus officinalis TaxID=4686 RepID=A0A5P1EQV8_ASPOF|nr:uncharacterized protein A4U43_C05F8620 [Asparagus officinalis]
MTCFELSGYLSHAHTEAYLARVMLLALNEQTAEAPRADPSPGPENFIMPSTFIGRTEKSKKKRKKNVSKGRQAKGDMHVFFALDDEVAKLTPGQNSRALASKVPPVFPH